MNNHPANLPPMIRDLLRTRKCSKLTCMGIGRWAPVVKINVVGQASPDETCKTLVPVLLCDRCKDVTKVDDVLTESGKSLLTLKVMEKRKKVLNWDTATIDWRDMQGKLPTIQV